MKKLIPVLIFLVAVAVQGKEEKKTTFNVGSFEVSLLTDGINKGTTDLLIGATPAMISKYAPTGTFDLAINSFMVRANGKTILVDSGMGMNLLKNLKALKIDAKQVNIILITHMHFDHIGGLLSKGKAVFPNAEIYIAKQELDYWTSAAEAAKLPEEKRHNFVQAQEVAAAYKDKLHLFTPIEVGSDKENLFAGFRGLAAFGHTPGHTCYLIESDGEKLLIWGDLAHAMALQMPYPKVGLAFDVDPKKAIAARQKILEYVVKNKIPVAGMHIVPPARGQITKSGVSGESYEYTPY
jgi:glyoxylase-like metal-dependent hydrolase (beta-lactamase superfamily II)